MFQLQPNPTFTAAVPLTVPGLPEPIEVQVVFRHQGKTALGAWISAAHGQPDSAVLHQVIESWSGVTDPAGAPVPYSITRLGELLDHYPSAHGEFFRAYLRELTESKRKN
jgi:hypothetical protein